MFTHNSHVKSHVITYKYCSDLVDFLRSVLVSGTVNCATEETKKQEQKFTNTHVTQEGAGAR